MAKRNEFLHNIAISTRQKRRASQKQNSSLIKLEKDVENSQRLYLQAQSESTLALQEANRLSQYFVFQTAKEQQDLKRKITTLEKQMKSLYTQLQNIEVNFMNVRLEEQIIELQNLLNTTLEVDDYFDISALKIRATISNPNKPDPQTYIPSKPTGVKKHLPGAAEKYEQEYKLARERYNQDFEEYKQQMILLKRTEAHNLHINQFQEELTEGKPEALIDYLTLVLEASLYPDDFPQHAKLAFLPESKQLVVEYDLPTFDIVPEIGSYKYVKAKDEITSSNRAAPQRKSIYSSVIAQITIRTIHELFEADRLKHLETIIFNGYVDSIDRGTGRLHRECLVTVRVTRDIFLSFNLNKVEPISCLKVLNASVSKAPEELAPVKPVLEFSMVDPRFIEETDVLSSLDQRPNLMDLKPTEFESLIANLFEKMGLETRQTQASRDGGVDCVAYDARPILGGKVVIQAKRYKHTVGVSAFRDLYGTLQNEGASKGILVTTSGYGKAAFDFASGKPIELLSGSNLLYLLEEHAGIKAKIVMPEDWKDTHPDSAT